MVASGYLCRFFHAAFPLAIGFQEGDKLGAAGLNINRKGVLELIDDPEASGTYMAYIDKNQPGDYPVLTVVRNVHGTTSIVLPKTLDASDLAKATSEADDTLEGGGFKRSEDWKAEDQYRLSAIVERKARLFSSSGCYVFPVARSSSTCSIFVEPHGGLSGSVIS